MNSFGLFGKWHLVAVLKLPCLPGYHHWPCCQSFLYKMGPCIFQSDAEMSAVTVCKCIPHKKHCCSVCISLHLLLGGNKVQICNQAFSPRHAEITDLSWDSLSIDTVFTTQCLSQHFFFFLSSNCPCWPQIIKFFIFLGRRYCGTTCHVSWHNTKQSKERSARERVKNNSLRGKKPKPTNHNPKY